VHVHVRERADHVLDELAVRRQDAGRLGGAGRVGDHFWVMEGVHRIEVATVESIVGRLHQPEVLGDDVGVGLNCHDGSLLGAQRLEH
jgi:hypothetical protein